MVVLQNNDGILNMQMEETSNAIRYCELRMDQQS